MALLYILVIWAYLAISPDVIGDESALAAAAGALSGPAGVVVISLAAAFSIAANTLGGGIVTPRMTYGMAEQQMLPSIFMHVSKRYHTPDFSILFNGATAILFSLWGGFAALAVASTLSRLVMYVLTCLALPVLEHREPTKPPFWHLPIALIGVVVSLWVASQAKLQAFQMLGLILVVGTGLYFLAAKRAPGANQT